MRAVFPLRRIMLSNYLPILLYLGIAAGIGVVLLVIGVLIGRFFTQAPDDAEKLSADECGFAFLVRGAGALPPSATAGLVAMGIFLAILVVGFIYEWKKGALEWD
jgi:NADH-quinone oxidoreductase subunit A